MSSRTDITKSNRIRVILLNCFLCFIHTQMLIKISVKEGLKHVESCTYLRSIKIRWPDTTETEDRVANGWRENEETILKVNGMYIEEITELNDDFEYQTTDISIKFIFLNNSVYLLKCFYKPQWILSENIHVVNSIIYVCPQYRLSYLP